MFPWNPSLPFSKPKRNFKRNFVEEQFVRRKAQKREYLSEVNGKSNNLDTIPLVVNFHKVFSGINRIISLLRPILHAAENMKNLFGENPIVAFRRPRNLTDELVRSKLNKLRDKIESMKKCGKSRCKICTFVEEGREFGRNNKKYLINLSFNCNSEGVIYLISSKKYRKNYVKSAVTSFSKKV